MWNQNGIQSFLNDQIPSYTSFTLRRIKVSDIKCVLALSYCGGDGFVMADWVMPYSADIDLSSKPHLPNLSPISFSMKMGVDRPGRFSLVSWI